MLTKQRNWIASHSVYTEKWPEADFTCEWPRKLIALNIKSASRLTFGVTYLLFTAYCPLSLLCILQAGQLILRSLSTRRHEDIQPEQVSVLWLPPILPTLLGSAPYQTLNQLIKCDLENLRKIRKPAQFTYCTAECDQQSILLYQGKKQLKWRWLMWTITHHEFNTSSPPTENKRIHSSVELPDAVMHLVDNKLTYKLVDNL